MSYDIIHLKNPLLKKYSKSKGHDGNTDQNVGQLFWAPTYILETIHPHLHCAQLHKRIHFKKQAKPRNSTLRRKKSEKLRCL